MKIEKIKYKDIKNMHANNNIIATHYIVDYGYDRYDYYIDINIQDYAYKLIDKSHDVYKEYIENEFFIYDGEEGINNFINIYGYLFSDDLINNIYKIVDEMNKVQKKEKEV